jgi:NAD+ kinase
MTKIALYGQVYSHDSISPINTLLNLLRDKSVDVHIEAQFLNKISSIKELDFDNTYFGSFTTLDDSYDLLISIGGDGTILRAVTYVSNLNIPIVGLNTGRLGFLATIKKSKIEQAINDILEGNYKLSERRLLTITTVPEDDNSIDLNIALNEIAVSRKNTTSMITVGTYLNDEYLTSYWADGLIIATPTGSTGYSLSCGGPVVMPNSNNFVITPIAPHNLNARPLVIADSTEIKLKVSSREANFLVSLDSRLATLSTETTIIIRKADYNIKMIELRDESFLKTLRKKLLWGEDRRN